MLVLMMPFDDAGVDDAVVDDGVVALMLVLLRFALLVQLGCISFAVVDDAGVCDEAGHVADNAC